MDTAATAIAIECFRRNNGELPEKLEQLVPEFLDELPTDPFDGRPLRYTIRKNGYTVYSVGDDRADDGGREDEGTGAPDVSFTVRTAANEN